MSDNVMKNHGTNGLNDVRAMLAPLSEEMAQYDNVFQDNRPSYVFAQDFTNPMFDTLLESLSSQARKYVRYGDEILIFSNSSAGSPSTLPIHLSTLPVLYIDTGAKEMKYILGRHSEIFEKCDAAVNSVSAKFGWKLLEGISSPEATEELLRALVSRLNDPITSDRALIELSQVMRVTSDFSRDAFDLASEILPFLNPAFNRIRKVALALHTLNYFLLGWTRFKRDMDEIEIICKFFCVVTTLLAHRNPLIVKLAMQGLRIMLFMRVTNVDMAQLALISELREVLYPILMRYYRIGGQPNQNEKILGKMALELVKDLAACNQDDSVPLDKNDRRLIAEIIFPDRLLVGKKRNCYMIPAETEADRLLWREHINNVWSDPLMRQLHKDLPYQKFHLILGLANYPHWRSSASLEVKLQRDTPQKALERYKNFHSDVLPRIIKMPNTDLEMVISYVSLTYEKNCKDIMEVTSPMLVESVSGYLKSDNLMVQRLAAVALGNILITANQMPYFRDEIEIEDPSEDRNKVERQIYGRCQQVKENILKIIEPFLNLDTSESLLFEVLQVAGYICENERVPMRVSDKIFGKLEGMLDKADKQVLIAILWVMNKFTYFITSEKMLRLMKFEKLLNTIYDLYNGNHRYAEDLEVRRRGMHSMIHIMLSQENEYRYDVIDEFPLIYIFWNGKSRPIELFKQTHRMIPVEFYGDVPSWAFLLKNACIPLPVLL